MNTFGKITTDVTKVRLLRLDSLLYRVLNEIYMYKFVLACF